MMTMKKMMILGRLRAAHEQTVAPQIAQIDLDSDLLEA